ncbi:MAG TPA: DUF4258 domain-containing protein [Blastocatellia bacterium]|nr:DUF4258 domain-containing protein [Blastocatellia bacterium]
MFAQILAQMREAAAADRVYLTFHANKELKADGLDYDDVIHCILTGEIMEQQLDDGEEKYVLYGDACNNDEIAVVAKLGYNQTTVIITVFRLRISDYDF